MRENNLMRIFIALEMPDEVIKEVARLQEVLGKKKFTGKMTELENLHLTLKFLGEIDSTLLEKVKEALRKVTFERFEARLKETGVFAFHGNPRIVWVHIGGKGVFELQEAIDAALEPLGFAKEQRFMSHLTIARVKYVKDAQAFMEYVHELGVKDMRWTVEDFTLEKSELKESGPVYTTLGRYRAANAQTL